MESLLINCYVSFSFIMLIFFCISATYHPHAGGLYSPLRTWCCNRTPSKYTSYLTIPDPKPLFPLRTWCYNRTLRKYTSYLTMPDPKPLFPLCTWYCNRIPSEYISYLLIPDSKPLSPYFLLFSLHFGFNFRVAQYNNL